MNSHTVPDSLVSELERAAIPYELLSHARTTSASAEARALDLDPHVVAKTVVLQIEDRFVRAVLPASERVDLGKVHSLLDAGKVTLASEGVLERAFPEFEVGAVPPLVLGANDQVLVDRRLLENEWVVLEAGTHERSLRLRTADLVALSRARIADLSRD